MGILEQIVASTQNRISALKEKYKTKYFEESDLFRSPIVSLKQYIYKPGKNGIIAEFKRNSPSKGMLNAYAKVDETTIGYMRSSCSALSILTEPEFFKGSNADLSLARKFNFCPILRKDFILDPIQIYESRAIGADAILLIAKILSKDQVLELTNCANELGLEVLLEIDEEKELEKINSKHHLIGINSRNLATMEIDFDKLVELRKQISSTNTIVAESGISNHDQVNFLREKGFNGFLIGSNFMKSSDPVKACADFAKSVQLNPVFKNETELI